MKNIVRLHNSENNAIAWIVMPNEDGARQISDMIIGYGKEAVYFEAGKVPFEMLPEEVQNEAKETLKAFDEVHVEYDSGRFSATTGVFLKAHYSDDEIVCGTYYAKDIFTEEERRQNFFETFGYYRK